MTIKPSDLAKRGVGMRVLALAEEDHEDFWEFFADAVDDVTSLYIHFVKEVTERDSTAAAVLTLATIMATPENDEGEGI